jgi:hypothetical protein
MSLSRGIGRIQNAGPAEKKARVDDAERMDVEDDLRPLHISITVILT